MFYDVVVDKVGCALTCRGRIELEESLLEEWKQSSYSVRLCDIAQNNYR
jgi:hypothetical protein